MSTTAGKTLSVLLVEDSLADGRLLLEALKPAVVAGELLVQTVKRLSLAADEMRRFDFNCVLLDLGLPDGQGVENVRTLRAVDQRPAIIVLTGLNDEATAVEALKLGAQDYLLKGETDAEELLRLIRRAIQRNRQTVQLEHQRDSAYLAATRDAQTLLPNLPLLLDLARRQRAETDGSKSLVLGVLVLDGLAAFRERAGAAVVDQWLRDAAQNMSERLHAGDMLACIAPGQFVLLPRAAVERPALDALLATLVDVLESLQVRRATALGWRIASQVVPDGLGNIEQAFKEAIARAATPGRAAGLDRPSIPAASVDGAAGWLPWVDIQSSRCAGATWEASSPAESTVVSLLPAWASGVRTLEAELTGGAADLLALALPEKFWASDGVQGVSEIKSWLATENLPGRWLGVVVPQSALEAHSEGLGSLQSAGPALLLALSEPQLPSFTLLARWPLQALLLPPAHWQRVIGESLRGPARRTLDALLGAAQALGIRVVATGVDQPHARDALRLIGLRWMQGAAVLSPLPAGALAEQWNTPVEWPR